MKAPVRIMYVLIIMFALCLPVMHEARANITNAQLMKRFEEMQVVIVDQGRQIAELRQTVIEIQGQKANGQIDTMTREQIKAVVDEHVANPDKNNQLLGGLQIGVGATFVGQHAWNTQDTKRGEDQTDGSYSIDLEIVKAFSDWGLAYLHLETGDGLGVDRSFSELFSPVNFDADDSDHVVNLTEVWYEHYLFDQQVAITAGVLDPTISMDQNIIAEDETVQFLSTMFRNSPVIDFPDNHLGFMGAYSPEWADWLEIRGGMIDGDSNGDDFFDHAFSFAQITLRPELFGPDKPGNYRFYFWHNDSNHDKFIQPDIEGGRFHDNHGWGMSADQVLTENLTAFGRFGWQDQRVANGQFAWSSGLQIEGDIWNREEDYVGMAFGQIFAGEDYRDATIRTDGFARDADIESRMEVYYNFYVNDHLSVSPDLQFIWNPAGNDPDPASPLAVVAGLRGQLDF